MKRCVIKHGYSNAAMLPQAFIIPHIIAYKAARVNSSSTQIRQKVLLNRQGEETENAIPKLSVWRIFHLLSLTEPITLAGFPTAIIPSGTSFVTTEPAPITALSPLVTPGRIMLPEPIHTPFPI